MAALREILISFGVTFDDAPIDKAEKKVKGFLQTIEKFGKALAGAFAVKKVFEFEQSQVSLGAQLDHQATLLGLSTRALEQWRYAAGFADISAEELESMFLRVSKAANSATDGHSANAKALKKLGVDVKDYKTSEDVFEAIGTKLGGLQDGYKKTALAAQFFGRTGGIKILELFKGGPDAIKKYREEFDALGGGMGDFAQQARKVEDQEKRLSFAFENVKVKIASALLPAFEWLIVKGIKLSVWFQKAVEGTNILATAFTVLGAIMTGKAALIVAEWLPVLAPFLLWAAAIALVTLAAEDLYGFFTGKNSLIGEFIDDTFGEGSQEKVRAWFAAVKNFATETFGVMKDIFGDTTKSWHERLDDFLDYLSSSFSSKIGGTFGDICSAITSIFRVMIDGIIAGIDGIVSAAKSALGFLEDAGLIDLHHNPDGTSSDPEPDTGAPLSDLDIANAFGAAPELSNKEIADAFGSKGGKNPPTAQTHDWYGKVPAAAKAPRHAKAPAAALPPAWTPPPAGNGLGFGDQLPATWDAPAPVVNNNFVIPPGTPQAQQRAIAAAAEQGTTKALKAPNRAAAAALGRAGK